MADRRAETILRILRTAFAMATWTTATRDSFATLIATIISQNTNDKNTARAFENLSNKFRITPETLAETEIKQIENCLKVAGLYHNKARAIQQVSRIILKKYNGNLAEILSKPLDEAREELLQLPGVGPKTADVLLLFSAKKPTIPVDTHVNRVSKRLGLVAKEADYETVRRTLQLIYDPKDYLAVHILLISHGRKYCKAKTPLCKECPLARLCPSRHLLS
ncbi:MAG: endonuclease III [Candidatus Bathyarchaeia archaeon]